MPWGPLGPMGTMGPWGPRAHGAQWGPWAHGVHGGSPTPRPPPAPRTTKCGVATSLAGFSPSMAEPLGTTSRVVLEGWGREPHFGAGYKLSLPMEATPWAFACWPTVFLGVLERVPLMGSRRNSVRPWARRCSYFDSGRRSRGTGEERACPG